jgi:hypothetical protein
MSYYDEMRQMQLEEEKKKKYKELAELNKILDKVGLFVRAQNSPRLERGLEVFGNALAYWMLENELHKVDEKKK